MSIKDVEQVVRDFLGSSRPQVLAVSGGWGAGKTYALENIIKSCTERDVPNSLKKYCYVSVFGLNNMSEIRTKIWSSTTAFPVDCSNKKSTRKLLDNEWTARVKEFAKGTSPYGKSVVLAFESVVSHLIKDTIVWLDDLERLSSGVGMEDLMGLVSELKEQLGCKVILVYNGEQLGKNSETLAKYSEKVIDQKLAFQIEPDEAILYGLPPSTPLRNEVAPYITALRIRNIRVVHRIARALEYIYPEVRECSPGVHKQVASSVAVFCTALYERTRSFPTAEEIIQYNAYQEASEAAQQEPKWDYDEDDVVIPPDADWRGMLEKCDYKAADEFDLAIFRALEQGYVHNTNLKELAQKTDERLLSASHLEEFQKAWDNFNHRFDVSEAQLAAEFIAATKLSPRLITPSRMSSTVTLMREIGQHDAAEELINIYIEGNLNNLQAFMPHNFLLSNDSRRDSELERRMSLALKNGNMLMSLEAAANAVLSNLHFNEPAAEALRRATADDLVRIFEQHQGENLLLLLERISTIFSGSTFHEARETLHEALKQIEQISAVNILRVANWKKQVKIPPV